MCIKARRGISSPTGAKAVVILVALALLTALAACAQSAEQQCKPGKSEASTGRPTTAAKKEPAYDPGELAGTEWTLMSLNGHGLVKDSTITLDFDDGVGGSAGCNEYGTFKLQTDGGVFKLGGMMSTTVGCGGDVGRQEKSYMRTLGEVTTYRRQGDRLELRNAAGETTLVYAQRLQHRSDPAELVGTKWMLHSMNGRPPVEGSTPTLSFDSEKKYSGYDGCRHFTGHFYADADDISFPDISMISMNEWDCMKPGAYTDKELNIGVLPADGDYRLTEGRLEIVTGSEDILALVPLREEANTEGTGAAWVLEKFVDGGAATPVLRGTEITLTFDRGTLRETGTVYGSAGCNTYTADYIYHRDDSLTLETLAVTKMACEDPAGIMQQEQRYLSFLKDVKGYCQKVDGRLHLVVTDERKLVFRP
jgi:heat shock protein HslJ